MSEANKVQIEEFKKKYCTSHEKRLLVNKDFIVEVETFEELLPGKLIKSYATGNREISRGFIVFKVVDTKNDITYYPVFSDTVGRKLVKEWKLKLPSKMTIFSENSNGYGGGNGGSGVGIQRKKENKEMLSLIRLARSMMTLHVNEPQPMRDPFKSIYNKLERNPLDDVLEKDIKSINTAISNFLNKPINNMNENFANLQEYIAYLRREYPNQRLRNVHFEVLRDKMMKKYPNETIVF